VSGATTAATAGAGTVNRLWFQPFYVHRTTTFDFIAVNLIAAGATGSVVRLGVYDNDPTLDDASELVIATGTVSIDGTLGWRGEAIDLELPPGMWWPSVVAQYTGSPQFTAASSFQVPVPSSSATVNGARFQAGVTGALPSTATPGTLTGTQPPLVFLRVAS
jgi:hypothetical protein